MNEKLQRKLLARNRIVKNLSFGLLADEAVEGTLGGEPLDTATLDKFEERF